MYGKIHEDIFDSSLMAGDGPEAVYVFMSLIVIADKDGVVNKDPRAVWRRLGLDQTDWCSFEKFMDIIGTLEQPDEYSNMGDYEGRRLVPLKGVPEFKGNRGWWLPTYEYYRMRGSKEDRKEQNRRNQQARRQRLSADVSVCQRSSAMSAHTDTDTDTDKRSKPNGLSENPRVSPVPYQQIIDLYHAKLPKLPKVVKLTEGRKRHIRARWKGDAGDIKFWSDYFDHAASSDFIHGKNDRGWFADIDFLIREDVMTKMQEGKYHA